MKKMKNLFAVLMAGIILACAGCANEAAPAETSASTTAATSLDTAIESEDTEAPAAPDEGDNADEPDEALPAEDEDEVEETPAMKLNQAIVDCGVEMPMLMILEDPEYLEEACGYNLSLAEDYCVRTSIMSAQLYEFTVIKPVAGKEQEALDMLEARKEALITTVAWYEDQKINAEATIVGSYNGYCYLLCDKNSEIEETALKKAIDELA